MPYPASTRTLQQWVAVVDITATQVKRGAQVQVSASNANALTMQQVRQFYDQLVGAYNVFDAADSVPGIAEYLTAEKQGSVADPVAEFIAMRNAIVATMNWLRTNAPGGVFAGDGQTYKLAFQFPANNTQLSTVLTFTAAQTAGYRAALNALIATIN